MAVMNESVNLSLSEAIRTGRLGDFIAQEEARGVGPAERKALDAALRRSIEEPAEMPTPHKKAPRPKR
jgi:hypothetical protein